MSKNFIVGFVAGVASTVIVVGACLGFMFGEVMMDDFLCDDEEDYWEL